MAPFEYELLKADIAANGLLEPIWVDGKTGKVIDGRHRLRAVEELGIEPRSQVWNGANLVDFSLGLNLSRRHLSESQRAMIAAKARPLYQAEKATGKIASLSAVALNVGRATVEQAEAILRDGAPELIGAVERGEAKVAQAYHLLDIPKEEQAIAAAGGTKAIKLASQNAKWRKRAGKLIDEATPQFGGLGKFSVVLADPPWQYEFAAYPGLEIENHYPTMALDAIKALPIGDILTEDAVLFLWSPSAKVAEACAVMVSWGFDFRSCAVWVKPSIGPGYYVRQQHEMLLIGVHGKPIIPDPENRSPSVIYAPRREHSRKPDEVYDIIEKGWPELPRIELFARGTARPGWVTFGNEATPSYGSCGDCCHAKSGHDENGRCGWDTCPCKGYMEIEPTNRPEEAK